jgi:hypothetical protein
MATLCVMTKVVWDFAAHQVPVCYASAIQRFLNMVWPLGQGSVLLMGNRSTFDEIFSGEHVLRVGCVYGFYAQVGKKRPTLVGGFSGGEVFKADRVWVLCASVKSWNQRLTYALDGLSEREKVLRCISCSHKTEVGSILKVGRHRIPLDGITTVTSWPLGRGLRVLLIRIAKDNCCRAVR